MQTLLAQSVELNDKIVALQAKLKLIETKLDVIAKDTGII